MKVDGPLFVPVNVMKRHGAAFTVVVTLASHKLALSAQERTRLSGNRDVAFKTLFPPVLGLVLNETVLSPLHWLQKLNARNPRSMVIYAEFSAD